MFASLTNLPQDIRLSFLRSCLVPVARFCLSHSFKLQEVQTVLKEVFVKEASELLMNQKADPSASKVALMTGVHRKDIAAITGGGQAESRQFNLLTKVIGQWQGDKKFQKKGIPQPLSCIGKDSDFACLVRKVNKEINPYTVLFELERAGLVVRNESDVEICSREFVPSDNAQELFSLYRDDGTDLLNAVTSNSISREKEKHLHLRTAFDNIPLSRISELRQWIFDEGAKFHKRARKKLARYDRDTSGKAYSKDGTARIVVTMFEFSEELEIQKPNDLNQE